MIVYTIAGNMLAFCLLVDMFENFEQPVFEHL